MKVTITAETGEQDIEITREAQYWIGAKRLETFRGLLICAVSDTRRAAGLPDDGEPGAILAAWRQIAQLVGDGDPLPLSPASVVDRISVLVERERAGADQ